MSTPQGYQPQHFFMAHIEFDDMGEMWSIGDLNHDDGKYRSQLATALTTISEAQDVADKLHREVVVITFVHGWHNNASKYDEEKKDLGSFRTVLQDLSGRYSRDFPDQPPILVGVFISWRGQAVAQNLFTTYWNRRDAAMRVGGPSLSETITKLMFQTKGVPLAPGVADKCESESPKKTSHFVVIGHSFGARALEHAVAEPMLSLIFERQMQAQECMETWNQSHTDHLTQVGFVAPADLVVFLNAANDSLEMKATIEALKRSGIRVRKEGDTGSAPAAEGPFMISITSDGDWATEIVMPVAQWFSMPGLAFRKYDTEACAEGQLCDHGQSYYYRHSAASIREMRSHTVYDRDLTSPPCQAADSDDGSWPYLIATVGGVKRCFEIKENDAARVDKRGNSYNAWNDTPAFVISVPKTLIPSHTDVFQDGTEELLITIANYYQQGFTKTTRLVTSAKSGAVQ